MNTNTASAASQNASQNASSKWGLLSEREREVAFMLATGDKNSDIAKALGISVKTVDTHRGHLLKKLDCRNNVDLLRFMIKDGQAVL